MLPDSPLPVKNTFIDFDVRDMAAFRRKSSWDGSCSSAMPMQSYPDTDAGSLMTTEDVSPSSQRYSQQDSIDCTSRSNAWYRSQQDLPDHPRNMHRDARRKGATQRDSVGSHRNPQRSDARHYDPRLSIGNAQDVLQMDSALAYGLDSQAGERYDARDIRYEAIAAPLVRAQQGALCACCGSPRAHGSTASSSRQAPMDQRLREPHIGLKAQSGSQSWVQGGSQELLAWRNQPVQDYGKVIWSPSDPRNVDPGQGFLTGGAGWNSPNPMEAWDSTQACRNEDAWAGPSKNQRTNQGLATREHFAGERRIGYEAATEEDGYGVLQDQGSWREGEWSDFKNFKSDQSATPSDVFGVRKPQPRQVRFSGEMPGSPHDSRMNCEPVTNDAKTAFTTLMLRNVPARFCQAELLIDLAEIGFKETCFDFFYLPINFGTRKNLGYAFMNCITTDIAFTLCNDLDGRSLQRHWSPKSIEVMPAAVQGFLPNVKRFLGGPSKRIGNPFFRPIIFLDGVGCPLTHESLRKKTKTKSRLCESHEVA